MVQNNSIPGGKAKEDENGQISKDSVMVSRSDPLTKTTARKTSKNILTPLYVTPLLLPNHSPLTALIRFGRLGINCS